MKPVTTSAHVLFAAICIGLFLFGATQNSIAANGADAPNPVPTPVHSPTPPPTIEPFPTPAHSPTPPPQIEPNSPTTSIWNVDANGAWSNPANWSGPVPDSGNTANLTFNITGNRVVTIDTTSRTVGILNIGDTNGTNSYTLNASGGASLIFDNVQLGGANAQINQTATSNNNTISAPIVLNSSLDITNASGFSLNLQTGGISAGTAGLKTINTSTGVVNVTDTISDGSGTIAVVQNGPGTLRLSAGNSYSGGTTVNGGILEIGVNGAVSAGGTITNGPVGTGTLTLNSGATLRSNNTSARTIQNNLSLSGNITLGGTANTGLLTFNSTDGTHTLTTPATVTLTGATTLDTLSAVNIDDAINGAFSLTKGGASTLTLTGADTYTGATTINAGILQLGSGGTTGSLSTSSAIVDNSNFTVNRSNSVTQGTDFTGSAITGTGSLTKAGSGTLTMNAANTYGGATTINAGTLSVDNNNTTTARLASTTNITVNSGGTLLLSQSGVTASNDRINDSATMTLNGGTFNTGGLSEHGATNNTAGIGALTLQSNSIINMGGGSSIIAFADSHLASWSGTLSIYNWSGTPVTGGGTDQLYFGNSSSGLTTSQLGEINIYSDSGATLLGAAMILADGEIVPVPEPATWFTGALLVTATLGIWLRRTHRRRTAVTS